ncbi:MAG: cellulose-binding protein [Hamadaea sp.]|uniref:cellulose-binding domain-containing protein n=1 Tax=Hamadaea sp. TaxID=2024425 RepID=UPI0017B0364D|nr:cellulose-binding domain-containing protein [Hamadaea sp.]NUT23886.1 cellulose-binding protein [Hamadaea sp.]
MRTTRTSIGALVVSVLATVGLAGTFVATAPQASAATACQVTYRVNEWPGGFVGYVDITAGATAIHGWTVTWVYGGDQKITSSWGATVAQSGTAVTATNVAYNGDINPGATVEFGVQGTWATADPTPTSLLLNGAPCGTVPTSPSASPSASISPSASPSTSPTSSSCGSLTLCEGFESQSTGTPSGAWVVSYPDCQGTGTATVDPTTAYRGGKSLKISGTEGYCNHVFVKSTATLTGSVWYARFYVRHTTALPASHVTFAALKDAADGNRDLRMGGQNGALQWNRQSDDATLPEQSPAGVALSAVLPVNSWNCVEFKVSGADGTMQTWLNGTEVAGLHEDGVPTHDIDQQWLSRTNWRPSLTDFRLGWESYGSGADTLWFDEVALGASRIGC